LRYERDRDMANDNPVIAFLKGPQFAEERKRLVSAAADFAKKIAATSPHGDAIAEWLESEIQIQKFKTGEEES